MNNDPEFKDIWIVTVNWNQPELTRICIKSIRENGIPDTNIVIVDNGSTDSSIDILEKQFPFIKLIQSEYNLGFSGGFNLGIKYALSQGAKYIFMVNNDTKVESNMLGYLFSTAIEIEADISSPTIYFANDPKKIWSAGGYLNPLISAPLDAHRKNKRLPNDPVRRDFLSGCALMIHKRVFEDIGFFDEDFFLYYEDLDFMKRANDSGLNIFLIPKAKLYHFVSASSKYSGSEKVIYWMGRSINIYFKKHAEIWQWLFIIPWQIGHIIKIIFKLVKAKKFNKLRALLVGYLKIDKQKFEKIYRLRK